MINLKHVHKPYENKEINYTFYFTKNPHNF